MIQNELVDLEEFKPAAEELWKLFKV